MLARTLVIGGFISLAFVAAPQELRAQGAESVACSDSLYKALKSRPVDSLSAREYELFRDRDRACLGSPAQSASPAPALAGPVMAATSVAAAPSDAASTVAAGQADGETAARSHGTGGYFVGGLASGVLLGLIGTGITYAVAASSATELTASELTATTAKGPVYQQGYKDGYAKQLKSSRKSSALAGGLLGTAAFVAIYLGGQ